MADYYPLIARAIAGLDPSAPGESRRALYERARAALIAQLRSVQPPLSESEITRERLSLEEAVRKVESEAAQRARDASRSGGAGRAGDAFRANTRPNARPAEPARRHPPAPSRRARRRRAPSARRPPLGRPEDRAPRNLRADAANTAAATAAVPAAGPDAGPAAAADPRTIRRAAPRPDNSAAAGAGRARLPRHRRRRRRSRPRRRPGQPRRAKNLCQRAVAVAGVRPARAEHGEPRRRSRRALFL